MGSRLADSEALVQRCKKVGWEVIRGTKGYKIRDADGGQHTVHLTYSDRMSLTLITQTLDRAGLSDAEKAIASARLTESRSRNDIAREVAEKRGKALANGTQLARAAGPYLTEAEDVGLDWFTEPHPRPWMRWANITPTTAQYILDHANTDNRPHDPATVLYYRDIILAGMWHLTHQGAAFDTRGVLQDGQHRFMAIVAAGEVSTEPIQVPMAVFVGMPVENFKAIDEGRLRTARQLFGKGGEKNTTTLQAAVRLAHFYHDANARAASRIRLPNQKVLDLFAADEDAFRASSSFGQSNYRKCWTTPGPLSAAHYLIRKVNGHDNNYVDQFFTGLTTGLIPGSRNVLDDDDPRSSFREKMMERALRKASAHTAKVKAESLTSLTITGMIVHTWNNTASTRKIRKLYYNDRSAIPEVLRCIPGEGARPSLFVAPPEANA